MRAATVFSVDFAACRGGRGTEIGSRSISELRSLARSTRSFLSSTRRKSNCAGAHGVVDMGAGVSLDLDHVKRWRTHPDLSGSQALDDDHRPAARWARPQNRRVSNR